MNILLIEDHPITAMGVTKTLETCYKNAQTQHVKNGKDALAIIHKCTFNLIICDILLPDTDTQNLVFEILRLQPNIKILMLSSYQDEIYAIPYLSMGASGYINKNKSEKEFIMAVEMVMAGQVAISQQIIHNNLNRNNSSYTLENPFNKLSKRELELLNHLLSGERMKDICRIMKIEQSTSSTLKKRIMTKLGVASMMDLFNLANQFGMK